MWKDKEKAKIENDMEYTVPTRKGKARDDGTRSLKSLDTTGGGRTPGAARGDNREPVGEVSPVVLPEPATERATPSNNPPDSHLVHRGSEPVSGAGTGSGSGARGDTALDNAAGGRVAGEAETERVKPVPVRNKDWFSHGVGWKTPSTNPVASPRTSRPIHCQ